MSLRRTPPAHSPRGTRSPRRIRKDSHHLRSPYAKNTSGSPWEAKPNSETSSRFSQAGTSSPSPTLTATTNGKPNSPCCQASTSVSQTSSRRTPRPSSVKPTSTSPTASSKKSSTRFLNQSFSRRTPHTASSNTSAKNTATTSANS